MPTKKPPATKRKAKTEESPVRSYRVAKTRLTSRSVAGHFPAEHVHAFRVLAATQDKDVQQLLAEGINLIFERHGVPLRIPIFSGRRTRQAGADRTP
jgi:hypothetical protein